MKFEWDENKNSLNYRKHKIHFETAAFVFNDSNRIVKFDYVHSILEDRYIVIGAVDKMKRIIVLVYCERHDCIRIISARFANKIEKGEYYDSKKRY